MLDNCYSIIFIVVLVLTVLIHVVSEAKSLPFNLITFILAYDDMLGRVHS